MSRPEPFGPDATNLLTRWALLAQALGRGPVHSVCCEHCRAWLGAVTNGRRIVYGDCRPDVVHHDGLLAVGVALERAVALEIDHLLRLQCPHCGQWTDYHRTR
jgi:hypothetical protein